MDDTAETRLPRLAPILLLGVLGGLAVGRPGTLVDEPALGYRLLTTLVAVTALGYVAWRSHGIVAAGATLLAFYLSDQVVLAEPARSERGFEAVFLATLALGVAGASRQGRPGLLPWVLLAAGAAGVGVYGWYGYGLPAAADPAARERLVHLTLALAVLAVPVGWSAGGSWKDRARLVAVMLGPPVIGLSAARLVDGTWPATLGAGDWANVSGEWREALATGTWDAARWCWAAPWVVLPLLGLGVYRTLARGWRQVRRREAPIAWLVAVATVGAMIGLGHSAGPHWSMGQEAAGVLLCAFGVFDSVWAVVERFELRPPDPGPSNIPRVK